MKYKMKFSVGDIVTDGQFKMKIMEIYKVDGTDEYFYNCVPVDDEFLKLLEKEEGHDTLKLGRIILEKALYKC